MQFELSTKKHVLNEKGEKVYLSKPKLFSRDELIKAGYDIPTLITGYGAFYYLCDRQPTASEPDCYTDLPDFFYQWIDQTNLQVWNCLSNVADAMIWQSTKIGNSRDYMAPSRSFGTVYTPNLMLDVFVSAIVGLTSTLLTTGQINVLINGTLRATVALSGVAATNTHTISFWVPAGATYELVDVHSNSTLSSVNELIC